MWFYLLCGSGIFLLLASILFYFKFLHRPHINGPKRGTIQTRFNQEREKMFVPIFQEYNSLSVELEGFIVTADPTIIKTMLSRKEHTKTRSRFYKLSRYLLYGMDGVLNMDGDIWKEHTRALASIFHGSHVDKHSKLMHNVAQNHLDAWLHGETAQLGVLPSRRGKYGTEAYNRGVFPNAIQWIKESSNESSSQTKTERNDSVNETGGPDLLSAVRGIAMDIILQYGFDTNPTSEVGVSLASELSLYPEIVGYFTNQSLNFIWNAWKLRQCTNRIRMIIDKQLIPQIKSHRATVSNVISDGLDKHGSCPNFITQMLDAGFSVKEIAGEVNHIHGAHKAVAFVLTCMLWRLSKHPEWVKKMRTEWTNNISGEYPTRQELDTLPVTRAVIHECLRMHVVSLGVVRQTGASIEINGVEIPSGTEMVLCLQALHFHPNFWTDPESFDPNRFLDEDGTKIRQKQKEYVFLPFLTGARMCAGKALAELQLAVVLFTLLSRVDIYTGIDELRLKSDMYAGIDGTIPFTVTPRNE